MGFAVSWVWVLFWNIPIALSPLLETFSNSRGAQETLKPPWSWGCGSRGCTRPLSPLTHPTQPSSAPFWEKLWLTRNLQCSSSSGMGGLSHWTAEIYEVHKWSSLERAQEWFELCPRSFIHRNAGLQGHGHKEGEQCQRPPSCLGVISTLLPLRNDDENQFPNLRVCWVFFPLNGILASQPASARLRGRRTGRRLSWVEVGWKGLGLCLGNQRRQTPGWGCSTQGWEGREGRS